MQEGYAPAIVTREADAETPSECACPCRVFQGIVEVTFGISGHAARSGVLPAIMFSLPFSYREASLCHEIVKKRAPSLRATDLANSSRPTKPLSGDIAT